MMALPAHARGVFFDLYGTLLVYGDMEQAWDDWLTALHAELATVGRTIERTRLADATAGFMELPEPPSTLGGRTIFERRVARALASIGAALGPAALAHVADSCVAAWQRHISLDPEALPVLTDLRRSCAVAVVSNFDHEVHVHRVLAETRIAEHVDATVISGEIGVAKPDPRVFHPALAVTALDPEAVVYVGDSEVDVEAARAAGMRPIVIDRTGAERPDGVRVIKSLRALIDA